jgi:hypothetical protein
LGFEIAHRHWSIGQGDQAKRVGRVFL